MKRMTSTWTYRVLTGLGGMMFLLAGCTAVEPEQQPPVGTQTAPLEDFATAENALECNYVDCSCTYSYRCKTRRWYGCLQHDWCYGWKNSDDCIHCSPSISP